LERPESLHSTRRFAPVAAALFLTYSLFAGGDRTARASVISRGDFIDAYAACNNDAWKDFSYRLIRIERPQLGSVAKPVTTMYPYVSSFRALGLSINGPGDVAATRPATIAWSAAAKAYADHGGIERRFSDALAARRFLRQRTALDLTAFSGRQLGALATDLDLTTQTRPPSTPLVSVLGRYDPRSVLPAALGRQMLTFVGTHEDVGSARVIAHRPSTCRPALRERLFSP
jgi:hypothetical protein